MNLLNESNDLWSSGYYTYYINYIEKNNYSKD